MTDRKALFLIEQLNPVLKKSTSYIRKLEIDTDNYYINMFNVWGVLLYQVDYYGRNILEVTDEIIENALY